MNNKCYIQHTYAILFIYFLLTFLTYWEFQCVVDRVWNKLLYIFFYELLILMIGLMSVALLATIIMWNILKTIYMKQKQKETILGW